MDKTDRAVILGRYIVATGCTVRRAAKEYRVSKSTVHCDVTKRLAETDRELCEQVRLVLDDNKMTRHIRGGMATKAKYEKERGDGKV